jgi:hypothetical protein
MPSQSSARAETITATAIAMEIFAVARLQAAANPKAQSLLVTLMHQSLMGVVLVLEVMVVVVVRR